MFNWKKISFAFGKSRVFSTRASRREREGHIMPFMKVHPQLMAVPESIISEVTSAARLPVIVGGGIRTARDVQSRVEAGASAIVIGNSLEGTWTVESIRDLAEAVHSG